MAQGYTSKATSINRNKLPAVYRKVQLSAPYVLDYGCGKYTDHIRSALPLHTFLPYDPYNQPMEVNTDSMLMVDIAIGKRYPVDVVCSNVLNVIDDDDTIREIVRQVESIVNRSGGNAYFTVYEGNRSGIGKASGWDQYQRNEPTRNYLRFFRNAIIKNGVIIIRSAPDLSS